MRTTIKACMSSNLGRIPPPTSELVALERLNKTSYNLVSTLAPSFLFGSSFLQVSQDPLSMIKRDLEGWREVLLPLNRLINWDKPFYPAIIVGITMFIFLSIWYFEPSVLTTFSLLGLTISLIDFLVPLIAPRVLGSSKWTGEQERQFEQICIRILNFRYHCHDVKDTMSTLKNEKPKVYFILVMGFLFLFAWVGSKVNNLLLTFIIVNLFLLMPGMRRHSVIQGYLNKAAAIFKRTVLGKAKSK